MHIYRELSISWVLIFRSILRICEEYYCVLRYRAHNTAHERRTVRGIGGHNWRWVGVFESPNVLTHTLEHRKYLLKLLRRTYTSYTWNALSLLSAILPIWHRAQATFLDQIHFNWDVWTNRRGHLHRLAVATNLAFNTYLPSMSPFQNWKAFSPVLYIPVGLILIQLHVQDKVTFSDWVHEERGTCSIGLLNNEGVLYTWQLKLASFNNRYSGAVSPI